MRILNKLFKTKKSFILFTAIVLTLFLGKTVFAVWSGTFYEPGDTLNPNGKVDVTNRVIEEYSVA